MPRARPNKRWLISKPARPGAQLSVVQRARLREKIGGLPEAVLPAVEEIAARFLRSVSYPTPSPSEMAASLASLREHIAALQKGIKETDLYTLHTISANYVRRIRGEVTVRQVPGLLERVESDLIELTKKINFINALLITRPPPPATNSTTVARQVQTAFQHFGVPFSTRKDSPAAVTVEAILNIVEPTGPTAAREAVRRVVSGGGRKKIPG